MLEIVLSLLLLAPAGSDSWPSFLGQGAVLEDASTLPTSWSPDTNVAWKASIEGYGQSSPVVWKGKILVTSVEGENKERFHVACFDLATGKRLWLHSIRAAFDVKSSVYVSRAAPTPVVDENGVYVFFETGDLVAVDLAGEPLWSRVLTKEEGASAYENRFCLGSSLAQLENTIFLLADHEGPSYLVAIDKKTGKDRWRTERSGRVAWSSPAVVRVKDRPQIVVSSSGSVDGYDAKTGELLWSDADVGGNTVASPIDLGEGRFLVGASPGERGQFSESAARSNFAAKIHADEDGKWSLERLWAAEKAMCAFSSPIVHEGHAYWVNRAGVVHCFDVTTGELRYAERLDEPCWATPIGVGDRVHFFGKKGITTVLKTGSEFEKLATLHLLTDEEIREKAAASGGEAGPFGGPTLYAAVAVDGSWLFRFGDTLYCVRKKAS